MRKAYRIAEERVIEGQNGEGAILLYVAPTEEERHELITRFGIDEHNVQSALDPEELARVELEPDHLAIIFKRPKNVCAPGSLMFRVDSLGLFLFHERLILLSAEETCLIDKPLTRIANLQVLALRLVHRCIQHFYGHLKAIDAIATEIEQKIISEMANRSLLQMFTLDKSLTYYLSAISSNGKAIERLRINAQNPATFGFLPCHMEYVDDLMIENTQCYEQARIYSDIFSGLMDARASIVSNNLNVLMRNLTLAMIALMWPPMVCGFFSMNVLLPVDQKAALWPFALVMILSFGPPLALAWFLFGRGRSRR